MESDIGSRRGGGRVTMQDVARRAGVSTMTVSRALTAPSKVAPMTLERVQEAVRALGYVPDLIAGSLSSGRSRVVAALVSTIANSVFAETVDGLSRRLRQDSYQLLLGTTDYSAITEEALVQAILGRRPDGLVIASGDHTEATLAELSRARIPVVETWDLPAEPIDMAVGFSNLEAGCAMTEALVAFGYRRIAFAGGGVGYSLRGQLRRLGYEQAIGRRGERLRIVPSASDRAAITTGAHAVDDLLERFPDADALFCHSDAAALGALAQCGRRGIRVPEQLAIAGFGDFDIAGDEALELTTVRVPKYEIGACAADILIERMQGRAVAPRIVNLGFEIVRRRTA